GGHSLLATQVISRIAELFEIELPLRVVFERPTIAGLATHLDEARRESARLSAPPIQPVPRTGPMPLSFAQQRLWFLSHLVRASLLNLDASTHVLLLTAHHIVSDGWSTTLLVDDLVRIYEAAINGTAPALAPHHVQYADFSEWQRRWLTGSVLNAQLDYWK